MNERSCDTCTFQHTELCPQQFGNTACEKFLTRIEKVHQAPEQKRKSLPKSREKSWSTGFPPRPVDTRPVKLRPGQRLYYEDGGEVKEGLVFKVGQDTFWFMAEGVKAELAYSVIGKRLFFSRKGAGMKK